MFFNPVFFTGLGWACRISIISFLIFGGNYAFSQYQSYVPSEFSDGDIIAIDFYIEPAVVGPELILTHAYAEFGFSIDPDSEISIDVSGSSFAQGSALDINFHIDHELEILTVTLKRLDNESIYVGGNGWICRAGGVGVLIDDIQAREGDNVVERVPFELNSYPNPVQKDLVITWNKGKMGLIRLLNLSGSIIKQEKINKNEKKIKWNLQHVSPGQYFILLEQNEERYLRKIIIY